MRRGTTVLRYQPPGLRRGRVFEDEALPRAAQDFLESGHRRVCVGHSRGAETVPHVQVIGTHFPQTVAAGGIRLSRPALVDGHDATGAVQHGYVAAQRVEDRGLRVLGAPHGVFGLPAGQRAREQVGDQTALLHEARSPGPGRGGRDEAEGPQHLLSRHQGNHEERPDAVREQQVALGRGLFGKVGDRGDHDVQLRPKALGGPGDLRPVQRSGGEGVPAASHAYATSRAPSLANRRIVIRSTPANSPS